MTDEQNTHLDLIRRIVVLKDLCSANYGVDADERLSIVNFKVFFNSYLLFIYPLCYY